MFDLDGSVREWRLRLQERGTFKPDDLDELESHLMEEIDLLRTGGLNDDEAFLVAVKRVGEADRVAGEFGKVNTTGLWKQLFKPEPGIEIRRARRRILTWTIVFALAAGASAVIPLRLGVDFFGQGARLLTRNLALFVIPFIAFFFLMRYRYAARTWAAVIAVCITAALVVNFYPDRPPHQTIILTGLHQAFLLWFLTGYMLRLKSDRSDESVMDFIRMTGELFIYSVLIVCGVMVFLASIIMLFQTLGVDIKRLANEDFMLFGVCATPVIAVFLAEQKRSIIENLAPVLARIFSPLFLAAMLVYIVTVFFNGGELLKNRDLLIIFDFLLALVLGMVLYSMSSRFPDDRPTVYDYINTALIAAVLVVNALALAAILYRITTAGFSANKTAALGENVLMFVNAAGVGWFYIRFLCRKCGFEAIIRFQVRILPVYAVWFGTVVYLFPLVFRFA